MGNGDTYNIFSDVARQTETTIEPYYAVSKTKEDIVNKAISDTYLMIILNVAEIIEAADSAVEIIKAIQAGAKTKFVVMAMGYSPKSSIVIEAAKAGVGYFMLSEDATGLKETYISTLANIKNVNNIIDIYSLQTNKLLEDANGNNIISAAEKFSSISIAVAGCINRIGVTNIAIQLIKYFMSVGKTACYIDNSGTDFIQLCREYYCCDEDDEQEHRIMLDGIDMYYNITAETLQNIYIKNYNFMVYDIGNISKSPQKQTEFLQKKYRLLCTGSKPNEVQAFDSVIKNIYRTNLTYLYSFVPVNDREDIVEDVKKANQKCFFIPFFDDCFSLTAASVPIFSEIFEADIPKQEVPKDEEPPKKRGLFGFREKKNKKG